MPKSARKGAGAAGQAAGARRPRGRPRSAAAGGRRRSAAPVVAEATPTLPPIQERPPTAPAHAIEPAPLPAEGIGESSSNIPAVSPLMPVISVVPSPPVSQASGNPAVISVCPAPVSQVSAITAGSANMLTSVCDDLGMGVPKPIQEKNWNGDFVEFGSLLRPANK